MQKNSDKPFKNGLELHAKSHWFIGSPSQREFSSGACSSFPYTHCKLIKVKLATVVEELPAFHLEELWTSAEMHPLTPSQIWCSVYSFQAGKCQFISLCTCIGYFKCTAGAFLQVNSYHTYKISLIALVRTAAVSALSVPCWQL